MTDLLQHSSAILALVVLSLGLSAVLYSSVGHGGASGYMAVMALFGLAPDVMRPVALCMNVVVTAWLLFRHRHNLRQLLNYAPLILSAIPMAFIGGAWVIESVYYTRIIGLVLLFSAVRLCWPNTRNVPPQLPRTPVLFVSGACLGLLAGLTGVGGGIFLSPLIVMMGWEGVKNSIVPVAAFIALNSVAGLLGFFYAGGELPRYTAVFVGIAFMGGLLGSGVALKQHRRLVLSYLLALVLFIAAIKMMLLGLH